MTMNDAENNGLNHEAQMNDVAMRMNNAINEITAQFAQTGLDSHSEDDVARDDYDDDEDEVIDADTDSDADTDADPDTDADADTDMNADADQNNWAEQFTSEDDGKQVEFDFA